MTPVSRVAGLRVTVLAAALLAAGCATAAPVPAPSPTVQVTQVLSPANLVVADGRRFHVARMNGDPATSDCAGTADVTLARSLVDGKTVTFAAAATRDWMGTSPPGFVEVDAYLPTGQNYADTFTDRRAAYRNTACPTPTTSVVPLPATTSAPSSGEGNTYDVDIDVDDNHESRYCRRHWFC